MHRLKENLIPNQTPVNYHLEFNKQFGDFNQLSDAKYTESINQLGSDYLVRSSSIKSQINNEIQIENLLQANSNQHSDHNSNFIPHDSSYHYIQIPSIELMVENQERNSWRNNQFKTKSHQLAELFSNKPYLSSKQVIILNPNEQNQFSQNSIFSKREPMKQGYIYPIEQNVAIEQQSLISLNNFPSDQDIEHHTLNLITNRALQRKTTLDFMNLKDKNDYLSTTSPESDRVKQQSASPQVEAQNRLKWEIAKKKQQNQQLQIISQFIDCSRHPHIKMQKDKIDWQKLKLLLEYQMSSRKIRIPYCNNDL